MVAPAIDLSNVADLFRTASLALQPDPDLTVYDWAAQRRILTTDDTPKDEAGEWKNTRLPWAVEIMLCLSPQHPARRVIYKASSQAAKTAIGLNFIGRNIDCAPQPMLVVQPTQSAARKWSRQRLGPMIKACPTLRGKIREGKGREAGNSTFEKQFDGGVLFVGWAGSAAELASMPIGIVFNDEISKFPRDLDGQGDALGQSEQRAQNFPDAKIFNASTPTNEGECLITEEYEAGDRRRLWCPCPDCGQRQVLVWEQVIWEKEKVEGKTIHHPETAKYCCRHCGTLWNDAQRYASACKGVWIAEAPFVDTASFEVWSAHLPTAWITMPALAAEFLKVRHIPGKLKRFENLKLGRAAKQEKVDLDASSLMSRLKSYGGQVPAGAAVLTAAVDVQLDRLEVAVLAWGPGEELWIITHQRIYGDPELDEVWQRLDALLARGFRHEGGAMLRIRQVCIDSRHKPKAVARFVRPREGRGIVAVQGYDRRAKEVISRPKKRNRAGIKPVTLATHDLKDAMLPRLLRSEPGPGYIHFCAQDKKIEGMDANYFAQFLSERLQDAPGRGRRRKVWVAVSDRTEAIDLLCYGYAALLLLGPNVYDRLEYWHERTIKEGEKLRAELAEQRAAKPKRDPDAAIPIPRGGGARLPAGMGAGADGGFVNSW